MSQFENERQLFSYTGLTPSEHSSGDSIRRGHIRQGNTRVRCVLCEAAWTAIRNLSKLTIPSIYQSYIEQRLSACQSLLLSLLVTVLYTIRDVRLETIAGALRMFALLLLTRCP